MEMGERKGLESVSGEEAGVQDAEVDGATVQVGDDEIEDGDG
jgi:hypothetical protein